MVAHARGLFRRFATVITIHLCVPSKIVLGGDIWRDPKASLADRLEDLLSKLTIEEMIVSMDARTDPTGSVDRLGIPAFTGWNECLHGGMDFGGLSGGTTSFPMPLGMAATFDTQLVHQIATIISDEMRATSNLYTQQDGTVRALNCFTPNINLVRDPRWGRNSETYGEDPMLTAEMAVAFVTGLQGNDSRYLKVGATCKHFAAYSLEVADGFTRTAFDAKVSERDMEATYLPAFKACVKRGGASSVMCSYNALNGEPTCAKPSLLQGRLRDEWGFDGFVVSDCGAINGVLWPHQFVNTSSEGNAASLLAGTDMNCVDYGALRQSLAEGLIKEDDIKRATGRILAHKFRLGMFDPPDRVPYTKLPKSIIGTEEHRQKAVEAAQKGIVLLKNREIGNGSKRLPLNPEHLKKVVLVGPHANSSEHLLGNYYGQVAGRLKTPLQVFQDALGADKVEYKGNSYVSGFGSDGPIDEATLACKGADACILFLGTSSINEHIVSSANGAYQMWAARNEAEGYDRRDLFLPGLQEVLAGQLQHLTDTPLIVVLVHGGPLDVQALHESDRIDAILTAWFPGQGAEAIADIILGKISPSGRLPVTFYYNNYTSQLKMSDFDMRRWPGRTHRYVQVPVLYPFGYGLSYTSFQYSHLQVTRQDSADGLPSLRVQLLVSNTGMMEAEHIVLLYLTCKPPAARWPYFYRGSGLGHQALGNFQRVRLAPGGRKQVVLRIEGDNLDNILAGTMSGSKRPAYMGSLFVEADGLSQAAPGNMACLLTGSSAAAA